MNRSVFAYSCAALIAGNAILSLGLWWILSTDPILPGSPLPAPLAPATASAAALTLNSVPRQSDPAAARLFGSQPAEAAALTSPDEATQSKEPALRLVGVILAEGTDNERIALVEYGVPARIARLHTDAQLDPSGWRVQRISSSSIELTRGGEHRTLKLD